jgi:hypothetical protein
LKRASLAAVAFVTGCGSGGPADNEGAPDGSNDAPSAVVEDAGLDAADAAGLDATVDAGGAVDGATVADAANAGVDAGPDPCADAGVPASTLACTGLYSDFANKAVVPNALAYTPSSPLWSDGAQKQRWIELPPNTQINVSNPDEWVFPIGTKIFKEFRVNGKRVETRLFQKTTSTFWVYATYAWNADDSAATISFGGPVPVPGGDGGATWTIPTNDDCNECHRGRQDRILGFEQVGLGLPGAQGLTLAQLVEKGLVTPAPSNVSLTIGDDGTGLDALALGWIHVNCGVTCHNANPSAAGFGAGMLLRLDPTQLDGSPPSAATWDVLRTTLNVPCVSGSLAGQPRIAPGDAAGSVVDQLISQRGALQMPPIASLVVDTPDVAVVASWIQSMGAGGGAPPGDDGGGPEAGAHSRRDAGEFDAEVGDASTVDATADGAEAVDAPETAETGPVDGAAGAVDAGASDGPAEAMADAAGD